MNLARSQALKIFLTSFLVLFLAIVIIHFNNYNTITNNHLKISADLASEISVSFEKHFLEKVKTVRTMSISPVILEALQVSNKHFGKLSKQQRVEEIQTKNNKWKSIEDNENQFIRKYTNNAVSKYLKNQQNEIKGEYGEIFITDKFGALIASTAKLTTFSHSSKYWWKGAYNNGDGAVFFDDRGYDDSVGGYVLGIVIPINDGNEIIGILKANLNILGSINDLILNEQIEESEKLSLIRSGGLIVYEKGVEPLSKRVPDEILEQISISKNSFILKEEGLEGIYAASEIEITADKPGYNFGGSFESSDHKKGNSGESWYVLDFHPISHIAKPVKNNFKILLIIGSLLSLVLAIISMAVGNQTAKPIKDLIKQTMKISKGDYNSIISTKRTDEIGQLAISFNKMTKNLKETTTSLDNLNAEIIERKRTEDALHEAARKWQTTFNASKDIIWVLNEDHEVIQSNLAAKDIFGKPNEDIIGMSCSSIVHNSQKSVLDCPFERSRKSLQRESMELNIGDKWFEVTTDPILNDDNKFIGAVLILRDIIDRKKIQHEIDFKQTELEKQFKKSEKQRIANLVILNDLNKTTKTLKQEITVRKQSEKIQKTLFNISNALNIVKDLDELFAKIKQFLGTILDTTNFFVALYDEKTDMLSLPFLVDEKDDFETFPAGKTLAKYVIKTGNSLIATNDVVEKLIKEGIIESVGSPSEIWLGVPLKIENRVIGIIVVQSYDDPDLYTEKDLGILSFVSEEIALAIEKKRAEEQIIRNLAEKDTLLKELYHRTKNNMQVISSMLRIQSQQSDDKFVHESFNEIVHKIQAMALVHQKLYQAEDLSKINLKEYIKDILGLLMQSYNIRSELFSYNLELKNVFVTIDSAMPLGLVLNELISNVFKHSFPDDRKGNLTISMEQEKSGDINIQLKDNGVGLPSGFNPEKTESMGLKTVYSLIIYQLNGSLNYDTKDGLNWYIKFSDAKNKLRV